MFLRIGTDDELSLEEPDDFSRFHIEGDVSADAFAEVSDDAGEGRFWISADAVANLSNRDKADAWHTQFWSMLEKAEPYGFSDVKGRRIKAHVE